MFADETVVSEETTAAADAPAVFPVRRDLIFAAVAVMLVAVLPYLNSLANGFALDDVPIVQGNSRLHSLEHIERIWTTPYWPVAGAALGLYRPLTSFLFAVQWVLGGGEAEVFHLVNVVLHGAASVLLFGFLYTLVRGAGRNGLMAALLGACVFAVHPVHTEAVANIVGQAELTAAIGVLGACWLYAARPAGARVGAPRVAALMLLYLLALCAKEHAIVLPALLVLIDAVQRRIGRAGPELRRYIAALLPLLFGMALVAGLFLAARAAVLGSIIGADANPALPYLRGSDRLWNAVRAWPEFYRLLLFPVDLSADYSPGVILPVEGPTPMAIAGGLLLLLTIIASVLVRTGSLSGFAAAWLLIAILPVSNLIFPIGVLVAERALYLPSVAVSVAVAVLAMHALPAPGRNRRGLAVAAGGLLVLLGVRTALRNPVWASTRTVQQSIIRTHPESYRAQWSAAAAAVRAGDHGRALYHFMLGYKLYDRDPVFVAEVGNFLIGRGELRAALPYLQRARALYPRFPRAQIYSAHVFNRIGRPDSAYAVLASIAPGSRDMNANLRLIWSERARALEGLGKYDEASAVWRLIAQDAGSFDWLYQARRARALALGGRKDLALEAAAAARASAPDDRTRAAVAALHALIESGCLPTDSCEQEPLAEWSKAL